MVANLPSLAPPWLPKGGRKEYPAILRREIQRGRTPEEGAIAAVATDDAIKALLLHYDIDPKAPEVWVNLALALMFDHVPAFRRLGGVKRGRPAKRESGRDARLQLLSEVNRRTRRRQSVRSALEDLEKHWRRHPKKNPFGKPRSWKTLQKDLKEARVDWLWRAILGYPQMPLPAEAPVAKAAADKTQSKG